MATESRHVSEVMATVRVGVVAEEKKGADPLYGVGAFTVQHVSQAAAAA